jgi:hypothetical protein
MSFMVSSLIYDSHLEPGSTVGHSIPFSPHWACVTKGGGDGGFLHHFGGGVVGGFHLVGSG